jgi:death on curing protein
MKEPRWLDSRVLVLLHSESLAEHGGSSGMRDQGLFESALARPRHLFAYEPYSDTARLAAAYGFGLARNHAFVDGNKRIAFIAMTLFLQLNGFRLVSEHVDKIRTMIAVASGEMPEDEFADWIRTHTIRIR